MPASAAMIGHGAKFEVEATLGASDWVELEEVNDITPPSSNLDIIDVTHMQSPDGDKEFITGLNDPGECSFTMNFIPGSTSDDTIQDWKLSRERRKARITFRNGVIWTFSMLVTAYNPNIPTADKMTATLTGKVSGSVVVS